VSLQPNPMRVHLAVRTNNVNVIGPLCHRPGAWRLTGDPHLVTCKACARMVGIAEVRR
jgi:hypothetical protein